LISFLKGLFKPKNDQNTKIEQELKYMIGRKPKNIQLYFLALKHNSFTRNQTNQSVHDNNERLEYLGDAVLGAIVAEFLFKKYPYKDEGFLTEIRSRIVKRESLNELGQKIGLDKLIKLDSSQRRNPGSFKSANGNALEALVGAIYLDRGYHFTRQFVLNKLIEAHIDMKSLVENDTNFKSQLIEWAQRANKELNFEIIEEKPMGSYKTFVAQVVIDGEILGQGSGQSKKKAEQEAAMEALKVVLGTS
jgi:ribonuclease-3